MSFINARLPERLAAGLVIGPEWRTEIVPLDSGREVRDAKWLYPRWKAIGNMAVYDTIDCARLRQWFVACRGQLSAFRVKDPLDWLAINEPIAPIVGTTTPVQLIKSYGIAEAGVSVPVRIQAPVDGTVTVYADGVAVAGTLDAEKGLFTPDEAWDGTDFTWSGQFDRWMRFASDHGAVTAVAKHVLTADVELVEVRR